jgi:hypothetical protein
MDEPLRNGLWSLLQVHAWDHVSNAYHNYALASERNTEIKALCNRLWLHFFKRPLDTLSDNWNQVLADLRKYFFECPWFEAYDFIEFVANNYRKYKFRENFITSCNALFEREVSAYRFVDGVISRITEREQIDEVEKAIQTAQGPVLTHMRRALELLASRDAPDYRNSIKESISAVESLVAITLGTDKGTLGQLLKRLEDEIGLHPALKTAFSNLYGYASDEGGIRHALLEAERVEYEDAQFFLVVCSAFTNYVQSKIRT